MKNCFSKKLFISLFCLISLFNSIFALSRNDQKDVQSNVQYPKPTTTQNGNVLVISSEVGNPQITHVAEIDKNGNIIYNNATISRGFSASGQVVQQVNGDLYVFSQHNKQGLSTSDPKEYIVTFKENGKNVNVALRADKIYQQSSIVALKNGKIFVAGIAPPSNFGVLTTAEVSLFNPNTRTFSSQLSMRSPYSNYIHCLEQKENEVYCLYVSFENQFIHKLKLTHYRVNGDTLEQKNEFFIKNFYTQFNFLKAVSFNATDIIVLFQVGDDKKPPVYGNNGKLLFYYQLRVDPTADTIFATRYELLYPDCKYRPDPEDYNADIFVLSQKRIYAVCETEQGRLKGLYINPDWKNITEFYFNDFDAKEIRYPAFAKFGQSLGLFYVHINENNNKKVSYQIMNYPDCKDYEPVILIPKNRAKSIAIGSHYFLSNPYPADRQSEQLSIRLSQVANVTIKNDLNNNVLNANVDYSGIESIKVIPGNRNGKYYIYFTTTRNDNLDGLIVGNKCKLLINTPECLDRCDSCTEKGTEDHHQCLGCNPEGRYYIEEDPLAVPGDYGRPHLCKDCDISCYRCFGPFLEEVPTTNCKICDYDNNYFHYEFNNKTCISNETKKYWESVYGVALYLDKTPGEDKKHLWRWRHCHKNCAECFEEGTDEDNKCTMCKPGLYFYCNQTEGHGIPGSCNDKCKNNGFYVTTKEKGREKCCPCINHCKECGNSTHCDKCYAPFFKTNEGTLCNETCGYCLAEDRNIWECVNCKYRGQYTLNKTCVSQIPFIDFLKRYYHIIDDQCNLLMGCKEGCHKCYPWYSDNCTECNSSYYKEDHTGENPQPKTFKCFDEPTCKGITPYIHDFRLKVAGVPVQNWNGLYNLCVNCKKQNDSYRLPAPNYYCAKKKTRTYVYIDDYNALEYCYLRCASCNDHGNGVIMNCTSCRDPSIYKPSYELFNITLISKENEILKKFNSFNCYRKPPKCGILPFYHDYDRGDELGLEDCGEECDICLYNMTCPEHLPFYVYSTRECIEYCGMDELFRNVCTINYGPNAGIILDNPLWLKDPYDLLNNSATLREIISSELFSVFDLSSFKQDIYNYIGNGKVYNLENSQIIVGNNISIEISSVDLELAKLSKLLKGQEVEYQNSILDISKCQNLLKNRYGLPNEESLILLKGDFLQKIPDEFIKNRVAYQLFSTSMGAFLPLIYCKQEDIPVDSYSLFNSSNLLGNLKFKIGDSFDQGLNIIDPTSSFYNDICTSFTNENGNDVLLDERRLDYFNEQYQFCENGCQLINYNEANHRLACRCQIKSKSTDVSNYETIPINVPEDFYKKDIGYSNIRVFKCSSQVFSAKGQKGNIGSYILLLCLAGLIGLLVAYLLKGKKKMDEQLDDFGSNPKKEVKISKEKQGYDEYHVDNKNAVDYIRKEDEFNFANYNEVKDDDTRSGLKMFWSFLKHKQIILFTFYTADRNLRILKISLFICFVAFYLAFTALFFNDDIIRAIYTYKGNTDAAVHVTNVVLSSVCSIIMSLIIRLVALNDRDVSKILSEKDPVQRNDKIELTKRSLNIRALIFYGISIVIVGVCWYYVSAFCAVFKNSQIHYFINTLFAFIVCNLWPFVTSGISAGLRKLSLNKKSPGLYKFSQIVSLF